jgi:hypothetical protein
MQIEGLVPRHDPMDDGIGKLQKEVEHSLGAKKCQTTTEKETLQNPNLSQADPSTKIKSNQSLLSEAEK